MVAPAVLADGGDVWPQTRFHKENPGAGILSRSESAMGGKRKALAGGDQWDIGDGKNSGWGCKGDFRSKRRSHATFRTGHLRHHKVSDYIFTGVA